MKTLLVPLVLVISACLPTIPQKGLDPRAVLPERLPVLAPCALVHQTVEENLGNGANGWFRGPWNLVYTSFLVRHPRGVMLIDAAMGDTTEADLDAGPWWLRASVGGARGARPLAVLLAEVGVRPEEVTHVFLTHAHWDHTGGLPQLPNARVVMADADTRALSQTGHLVDAAMPSHFAAARGRIDRLSFDGPAYDGFAHSADVLGDGSVVAVPTPGHTPGATSWFVNSGNGRRWLFAGDAAWVREGFTEPVMRGRLASTLVDWDKTQTADVLGRLHALEAAHAAVIVTSHDERTWQDVPRCGKVAAP